MWMKLYDDDGEAYITIEMLVKWFTATLRLPYLNQKPEFNVSINARLGLNRTFSYDTFYE